MAKQAQTALDDRETAEERAGTIEFGKEHLGKEVEAKPQEPTKSQQELDREEWAKSWDKAAIERLIGEKDAEKKDYDEAIQQLAADLVVLHAREKAISAELKKNPMMAEMMVKLAARESENEALKEALKEAQKAPKKSQGRPKGSKNAPKAKTAAKKPQAAKKRKSSGTSVTDLEVWSDVKENPGTAAGEIAKRLNVDAKKVSIRLVNLNKNGHLNKKGDKRNTTWTTKGSAPA